MRIGFLLLSVLLISSCAISKKNVSIPKDEDPAYTRTINNRAEKIVATLGISDSLKAKHIIAVVANQYRNLNTIYTKRDEQIKSIQQKGLAKEEADSKIKNIQNAADKKVEALHAAFLSKLSSELSPEQVTKVKDGMTYNVLHVTYDAYVDMIPSLTTKQKDQIMAWLVEAREHAMDGESSEKKHWWFGKYKGRINNYLSAQGYDLQTERQGWEERRRLKKAGTN
jgi:hypothetical protein